MASPEFKLNQTQELLGNWHVPSNQLVAPPWQKKMAISSSTIIWVPHSPRAPTTVTISPGLSMDPDEHWLCMTMWFNHQPTNQPTNQSTNQLTNQPTNQPINQPTNQPTNQPINQPTHQPTNQPTNQSTNHIITNPINFELIQLLAPLAKCAPACKSSHCSPSSLHRCLCPRQP